MAEIVIALIRETGLALINVIWYAMFFHAILSWFDPMIEWGISVFLRTVTDPVIFPVRRLCEKMHWFEGTPLDMPFMLTWLVLVFLRVLLEVLL